MSENTEYKFSEMFDSSSLYDHTKSIILDKHLQKGTATVVTHALAYWKKADSKKRTVTLQKKETGVATFMWFPVKIEKHVHPHVAGAMKKPALSKLVPLLEKTLVFGMHVLHPGNRNKGKGKKYLQLFSQRFADQIRLQYSHALISVEKRDVVAFQFACAVRAKLIDDSDGRVLFFLDLNDFKV